MKKILSILIIVTTLVSCGEEIKTNNYAVFQGVKDNGFWRGGNAKATLEVGNKITVEAVTLTETMSLKFPVPTTVINPKKEDTFVTYPLGTSLNYTASYIVMSNDEIFTYETGIGLGDGEVVISSYDGATISGTFRFNAINRDPNSDAPESVNLQEGVFYRVPVNP